MDRTNALRCMAFALVMALIAMGSGGEKVHASSNDSAAFCSSPELRDYLAPLDRVPLSSPFRPSGQLNVGPDSLRILVSNGRLVPIGKALFGARGSVLGQGNQSHPLKWTVVSELEKMRGADAIKVLKSKRQYVGKVSAFNNRQFGFASRGLKPGLYRLTVEIQTTTGRVLETHQEAFRAVTPRSELKLVSSFTRLAPGEAGQIRVDNLGTVEASFGGNYRLWTANGEEVPVNPVFGNVLYKLPAGLGGPCYAFTAPYGVVPGEYRISSIAGDLLHRKQMLTTSVFIG